MYCAIMWLRSPSYHKAIYVCHNKTKLQYSCMYLYIKYHYARSLTYNSFSEKSQKCQTICGLGSRWWVTVARNEPAWCQVCKGYIPNKENLKPFLTKMYKNVEAACMCCRLIRNKFRFKKNQSKKNLTWVVLYLTSLFVQ